MNLLVSFKMSVAQFCMLTTDQQLIELFLVVLGDCNINEDIRKLHPRQSKNDDDFHCLKSSTVQFTWNLKLLFHQL